MGSGRYYMVVGVVSQGFPRNGTGGVSSQRVAHSTLGAFTRDSVVLTGATLTSVAAGDYIFTNNGYWGIVKTADNVTKLVTLRTPWTFADVGIVKQDVIPTGAATVTIHSGNHPAQTSETSQGVPVTSSPFRGVTVRKIVLCNHAAAGGITITNAAGGVEVPITLPAPATQNMAGLEIDLDLYLRVPFGVTTTGASNVFLVTYDMEC